MKSGIAIRLSLLLGLCTQTSCKSDESPSSSQMDAQGGQTFRDPSTIGIPTGGNTGIILPMDVPSRGGDSSRNGVLLGGDQTSPLQAGRPGDAIDMLGMAGTIQPPAAGSPVAGMTAGSADTSEQPLPPSRSPRPGDIIITEIMFEPGVDGQPAWVEMYNRSDVRLNLDGCLFTTLMDGLPLRLPDATALSGRFLESGTFLVLVRGSSTGDAPMVGNVIPDDVFTFDLSDSETIRTQCGADIIDEVAYSVQAASPTRFNTTPGRSLSRSGSDNQLGADGTNVSWCAGESSYTDDNMNGPFGTPGLANPACNLPGDAGGQSAAGGHSASGGQPVPGGQANVQGDLNVEEIPPDGPAPGQAIINEILVNSVGNDGQTLHEWIELFNPSNAEIDLNGCTLSDDDLMNGEALVLDGLTIESMGYLIFGQSGDIEMNGGVDIARIFDFQMRNGGETIRLTCDGQISHQVYVPRTRDGYAAARSDIDGVVRWCESEEQYNAALQNFGTPGQPNPPCR